MLVTPVQAHVRQFNNRNKCWAGLRARLYGNTRGIPVGTEADPSMRSFVKPLILFFGFPGTFSSSLAGFQADQEPSCHYLLSVSMH